MYVCMYFWSDTIVIWIRFRLCTSLRWQFRFRYLVPPRTFFRLERRMLNYHFVLLDYCRIRNNGGTVINRKIESLSELCGEYDIIFNCTGLQAKKLCDDMNLLPIRGQVIRVTDIFNTVLILKTKRSNYYIYIIIGIKHFTTFRRQNTKYVLPNCQVHNIWIHAYLMSNYTIFNELQSEFLKIRIKNSLV